MRFHTLSLLLSGTLLLAQGQPQPRQPSASEVKAALGLDDNTVSQLQQLRRDQREALRSTFQQIRDDERKLRVTLQAGGADPTALGNLLLSIQDLRKQVRDSGEAYRTQALALLNDEQKAKLKGLEEAAKLRAAIGQAAGLNLLKAPGPGWPEGMAPPPGRLGPEGARFRRGARQ